jgi:hypothetical protein
MIGTTSASTARSRVRLGTNTQTIFTQGTIQNDALNLVAGGVRAHTGGSGNTGFVSLLREGGVYETVENNSTANTYFPRGIETDISIAANAGANDNPFHGDIIGIWAFDRDLNEEELRVFFANPWQVFAPQRYFVPLTVGEAVVLEEPAATNALGTPQIAELIASGQVVSILKASGAVVLAPLTSAGAAALVSGVLAATGSPTFDELLSSGAAQRTSVNITDVNTTESWTDGSSSIPISGSGFS